jgi:hypothetical protein
LVDFLIEIGRKGWMVEPGFVFRDKLEEHGYYTVRGIWKTTADTCNDAERLLEHRED